MTPTSQSQYDFLMQKIKSRRLLFWLIAIALIVSGSIGYAVVSFFIFMFIRKVFDWVYGTESGMEDAKSDMGLAVIIGFVAAFFTSDIVQGFIKGFIG